MSIRLSKYIASFGYFDNSLIALCVTTGSISIVSFATVIEAPVGIISASFSLAFGFTYSACGPFTKNKERIQKFKETGDTIFTKTNLIRLVFNMIWHMEILKI